MVSDINRHRRAFWTFFEARLPERAARMVRGNEISRWLPVGPRPFVLAHYISARGVGLFVRGPRGNAIGHVREDLFPHREFLLAALDRPKMRLGTSFLLNDSFRTDTADRDRWPEAVRWFAERSPVYEAALLALQTRRPAGDWPG